MKAKLKTHGGYLATNGQVFEMCGYIFSETHVRR